MGRGCVRPAGLWVWMRVRLPAPVRAPLKVEDTRERNPRARAVARFEPALVVLPPRVAGELPAVEVRAPGPRRAGAGRRNYRVAGKLEDWGRPRAPAGRRQRAERKLAQARAREWAPRRQAFP